MTGMSNWLRGRNADTQGRLSSKAMYISVAQQHAIIRLVFEGALSLIAWSRSAPRVQASAIVSPDTSTSSTALLRPPAVLGSPTHHNQGNTSEDCCRGQHDSDGHALSKKYDCAEHRDDRHAQLHRGRIAGFQTR